MNMNNSSNTGEEVACATPTHTISRLVHSVSRTSTASSGSFQVRTRALRPVAASIISYGRSSKISKSTTLYVIRVARAGKSWYVARRYSEFRALHAAVQTQFVHEQRRACAACHELATFYSAVRFPQRFRLRSALFSKRDIEPARMAELNKYVQLLIETTQGLLADDDDDSGDSSGEAVRCEAVAMVRDFLMVDANEETLQEQQQKRCASDRQLHAHAHTDINTEQQEQSQQSAKTLERRRPRLASRSSSVASFRVDELDVLYKEKEADCVSCFDALASASAGGSATLSCDPVFDDVFDDFAAPPPDALVQHQWSDDSEQVLRAGLHPLRRSESLCRSRN